MNRLFMDRLLFVLLDLRGRVSRRTWLVFALSVVLLNYGADRLLRSAFHWPLPMPSSEGAYLSDFLGDGISVLTGLMFLWPAIAVDVKRWHDLGVSGWAVLLIYGPASILYGLWFAGFDGTVKHPDPRVGIFFYLFGLAVLVYFIVLGAKRGVSGANRYGPVPQ